MSCSTSSKSIVVSMYPPVGRQYSSMHTSTNHYVNYNRWQFSMLNETHEKGHIPKRKIITKTLDNVESNAPRHRKTWQIRTAIARVVQEKKGGWSCGWRVCSVHPYKVSIFTRAEGKQVKESSTSKVLTVDRWLKVLSGEGVSQQKSTSSWPELVPHQKLLLHTTIIGTIP